MSSWGGAGAQAAADDMLVAAAAAVTATAADASAAEMVVATGLGDTVDGCDRATGVGDDNVGQSPSSLMTNTCDQTSAVACVAKPAVWRIKGTSLPPRLRYS